MTDDMTKTQETPIVETMAELRRADPLGVYSFKRSNCRICGRMTGEGEYCIDRIRQSYPMEMER